MKFNPGQLRVPAGQPGGGQWTDGDGGGAPLANDTPDAPGQPGWSIEGPLLHEVARPSSVPVRIGGTIYQATPGQATRHALATTQAEAAIRRVRERDPTWSPSREVATSNDIEGHIARANSVRREAADRHRVLDRARFGDNQGPLLDAFPPRNPALDSFPPPPEVMRTFRSVTGMPDLGDGPATRTNEGSVAHAVVGGQPFIGVNSCWLIALKEQ